MKPHSLLLCLATSAVLLGCDRIASPTLADADSSATVASRGDVVSTFQMALRGTWSWGVDSIQVTLRRGDSVRTISGSLATPLWIEDLPSGRWTAEVVAYPSRSRLDCANGSGLWALDTIEVPAGGIATLDPSLVPADLHLGDLTPGGLRPGDLSRPSPLAGTWHLRNWTGSDSLLGGTSLTLFRSGMLVGFDGRDSFPATWGVDSAGSLSILPVWEHPWPELEPSISFGAAEALASLRGMRIRATAESLVLDIAGDALHAVFTRSAGPLTQTIHPRSAPLPQLVVVLPDSSIDTTSSSLLPLTLTSVERTDSFAILTVETWHPSALPRLAMISHMEFVPTGGCVSTGTPDTLTGPDGIITILTPTTTCSDGLAIVAQKILVASEIPSGLVAIQARAATTRRIAVPLSSLDERVEFHDRAGNAFDLPR